MSKMSFYFAIEGIIGSGKTTLLEWLKIMLLDDGHTFHMIPEPVEKFKKKITYNPLDKCYREPLQSAAMAQIHMMDKSIKHYTREVAKARKMKLDLILSEWSIVSPLIFTDAYFLDEVFSTFTKDSIDMMWGDETGGDADLGALKPDAIIFLKVSVSEVKSRLKREPPTSSWSEVELEFLTKHNLGRFLYYHEEACERFRETTDIPYHVVEVDENLTPREVALQVYRILKGGIGADWDSKRSLLTSDQLFEVDEETE